jgi:hypothetical protein
MPLTVRLDAKTKRLIGRPGRKEAACSLNKRRRTLNQVPYDLIGQLIGCVRSGASSSR